VGLVHKSKPGKQVDQSNWTTTNCCWHPGKNLDW